MDGSKSFLQNNFLSSYPKSFHPLNYSTSHSSCVKNTSNYCQSVIFFIGIKFHKNQKIKIIAHFCMQLLFTSNTVQGLKLTVSLLPKNMTQIYRIYRYYEDRLKAPPTYSYLAPRVAILFAVTFFIFHSINELCTFALFKV